MKTAKHTKQETTPPASHIAGRKGIRRKYESRHEHTKLAEEQEQKL